MPIAQRVMKFPPKSGRSKVTAAIRRSSQLDRSPAGRRTARNYSSCERIAIRFFPDDLNYGIFRIDSDGTNEKFICEGRWPDWSPSGKSIVFAKDTADVLGQVHPLARIYVARADGSHPELIANGNCPTWSPDGKMVACTDFDPAYIGPRIRIIAIEYNRQWFVGYGWQRANWAPDSRSVTAKGYMTGGRMGPVRFTVRGESGKRSDLTAEPGADSPCLSPDGRLLVFSTPYDGEVADFSDK